MFSGLSNQVSSWMGTVKGETEEKVPTPTDENNALLTAETADPNNKEEISSPTKTTAGVERIEMFSKNVKSQFGGIGGWLGSSIPKLRKGGDPEINPDEAAAASAGGGHENPVAADLGGGITAAAAGNLAKDEDDDNSRAFSATEGADSGPASLAESPTDENKEGQFGNVQSKALAGAKSFGSFLYSAVNKAGKTVTEAGSKIHVINNILGEFNKEQDSFVKSKSNSTSTALPPWAGCANEEKIKEDCLSLSTDRRNFVRAPPVGVDFQFDYEVSYPVATAIMEQDPNLEKMRYELVPKIISEEEFWKNYFYRVSLICQANESAEDADLHASIDASLVQQQLDKNDKDHEFISDTLIANKEDLIEVEEGMKKLQLGSKRLNEDDWEKELEAELQDYEMVPDELKGNNLEKEIEEILNEEPDLK